MSISHSQSACGGPPLSAVIEDRSVAQPHAPTDLEDALHLSIKTVNGIAAGRRSAMFSYLTALREQFAAQGMTRIVEDIDTVLAADGLGSIGGDAPAPDNVANARRLGRAGGIKGGISRAKNMTAEQRSESARKAAQTRWARRKAGLGK
jgi:hypothetical protein